MGTGTIQRVDRGTRWDWFNGLEVAAMPTVVVETCLKDPQFIEKCAEGLYQGIAKSFNKN